MRYLLAFLVLVAPSLAQSGGLINGTRGIPQPNDPSGTTLYSTAIVNASGNAATAQIANTTVPVRIVVGGAGTTGNAVLASTGTLAPCTMDTAVASGGGNYFVIESTTNAGYCHPQAAAPASGVWVIGYLHDAATTVGAQALVHVNGFIYGGGGGGGTITGATANGGLTVTGNTLGLLTTCTNNQILQFVSSAWGCAPMTGGGSGTVSANNGTAGAVAYYAAAGGSTTVTNSTTAVISTSSPGITLGGNMLSFGPSLTSIDSSIQRLAPALLGLGNQFGGGSEVAYIRSANSCTNAAGDVTFTTTAGTACSRALPAIAKPWIVHCSIPWNFTAGTGTAVVSVVMSMGTAPVNTSYFTTVLWGTAGPVFGTAQVTNTTSTLVTTAALDTTDARLYSLFIDGVVNLSASGANPLNITLSTSNGTGAIKAGAYCRFE